VETFKTVFPFLIAILFFIIGIKTIITRETTVILQLWSFRNDDMPRRNGGGYSESTQTGFIAILVGIIEIATAVGILLKFHH
jgi:NADH:ubiquinone oxidoreductase subunit K